MADGDFEGNKLGIFDGHTLGEANRDLLGMTDGDFKGSISHQDDVETLSSSCMLDDLSCGKMCHPHICHGFVGVMLALAFVAVEMRRRMPGTCVLAWGIHGGNGVVAVFSGRDGVVKENQFA